MPSSYTTSLRLTLPATGELSGQWGNTVNTGITELLDAAVAGTASISTWGGAGVAYTLSNNSGTADEARKMFIVATGSPGEAKNVICPAVSKFYVFRNDTTGGYALTLKTSGGTGIAVPAGQYKFLYCDGTNVVEMFNSAGALTLSGALSVGGTTTLASNPTLSAGTANQVQYLNGSKVLSGSANLTFDGTTLTGAGFSGPLNGSVGATTPSTGAFTTLSASSTVSGTGFTNLFASPPAIGGTAANTGAFTTLTTSSTVTLNGGTANGVLYLNGSKVATSGSALTFDGTKLLASASASITGEFKTTSSTAQVFSLVASNDAGTSIGLGVFGSAAGTFGTIPAGTPFLATSAATMVQNVQNASGAFVWGIGATPAEQMRLTSTGLGIGTSSPSFKLDAQRTTAGTVGRFYSTAGTDANISIKNNTQEAIVGADNTQSYLLNAGAYPWTFWTNNLERMRLDSSGNLGIGTSSPAARLHVLDSGSTGTMRLGGTTFYGSIQHDAVTTGANIYNSQDTGGHLWQNSGSTVLTLSNSGNLGLGVTPSAWGASSQALQNGGGSFFQYNNDRVFIGQNTYIDTSFGDRFIGNGYATRYRQYQGTHAFYVSTISNSSGAGASQSLTQAMTLDASGNLGLGVTSMSAAFELKRGASTGCLIEVAGNNNTPGTTSALYGQDTAGNAYAWNRANQNLYFGTNNTERARITSGGELCVGTTATNSGARLDVKGVDSTSSTYCMFFENSSNSLLFAVQNDGRWRSGTAAASPYNYVVGATNRDLFVDNGGEIGYVSSVRASKTNIAPVSNVDWLLRLNPVTFNFRKKDADGNYTEEADGPLKHGLIAEEVEAVNSDLCFYDDAERGGALRGVNYTHLITPMLKLIQEQQALITALTARVAALEAQP